MHYYARNGHEVRLLTLTRGEATKIRYTLGLNKEEMGVVREKETRAAAERLGASRVEVLDFPDAGLKELDPAVLEKTIESHCRAFDPEIIVSYPVHGISGFHDHLVTHAVVKRVFCQLRLDDGLSIKRLAFTTLRESDLPEKTIFDLHSSSSVDVDCVLTVEEEDYQAHLAALDEYETYTDVINKSGVKKVISLEHSFEFFQETFDPPVESLLHGLV